MWAEFREELEIVGEQAEGLYRNLRRVIGYAGEEGKALAVIVEAVQAEEAARAAAVRTRPGGDRAARRGAVAEMCTAF